jgi:hypothetical protein
VNNGDASSSSSTRTPAGTPRGVPGAKFLRAVARALAPLKDVPAHGNRTLHLHPLVVTLVTSFYDPAVRSLRAIEAYTAADAPPDLGDLALRRMARSTTSDALAAFDPELLRGVIEDLQKRVPDLRRADPALAGIVKAIVAADGSYFSTFADVAWALHHTKSDGRTQAQVRMNLQIDAATWVPRVVTVTGGETSADRSEPDALARDLQEGVLYVIDRGFIDFDLLNAMLAKHNDFVLRVKADRPAYETVQTLALTDEDVAAGIEGDQLVRLTGVGAPQGTFRLVEIKHASKPGEVVRLLTNLTDPKAVPARVVGHVYKQRWQIELFFRWLKVWCNFDHLLSTSRRGITTQFYVTVIATLLTCIHLGRPVSKYTLIALHLIASGRATPEQMNEFLDRRDRERDLDRARRLKKAAAAKKA